MVLFLSGIGGRITRARFAQLQSHAGPRSFTFSEESRRRALESLLSVTSVVMATESELQVLALHVLKDCCLHAERFEF
jgi:hypothetical protein